MFHGPTLGTVKRNLKEKEFGGMYCVELSVNSTIVSAGVFRVFSKEVAEIPLVATSKDCEGKGYFQCLYSCLESFIKALGVKNLLLPAAEETRSLWINKFRFNVMPHEETRKFADSREFLKIANNLFKGALKVSRAFAQLVRDCFRHFVPWNMVTTVSRCNGLSKP
ncbi:hypothetical protein KSS87_000473 [Heliosperma pusillum]|nr:hypothetical protein KSS87_000473 [Heliosperma pusillum]